jgi:capsule biosynthesis phosphatase
MIIVIPLGGIGQRFKTNGYKEPKALIKVFGKPILYYLLDNLNFTDVNLVCIPYNKEYKPYRLEDMLRKDYPSLKFNFIPLEKNTRGAAETLHIALSKLKKEGIEDAPFLSLDGDNFYTTDIVTHWQGRDKIFTVLDKESEPIYSFVKVNNQNKVEDIVEKQRVSNLACTGAYGFKSYQLFLDHCEKILTKNEALQQGEFYISSVVRTMLKLGVVFNNCSIERSKWSCLGTPIQVRSFCNNYPLVSCKNNKYCITKQRICFDLDNTLVTFPSEKGDYTSVQPIQRNIDFLKYLRNFGHTIIIYTARRMKSHSGNVGRVMADIGKITFDTLERFDIPYDEIYFGKPYANVYIDDAGLNAFDNLEKSTGYYMDNITPRDFNEIEQNSIETYTKRSQDLSGEIFYYRNIPPSIKDMFPCLIDFDAVSSSWYTMEKIKGLTLTSIYLSELMTTTILRNVMNSLKRIQSCTVDEKQSEINIYANYAEKMKQRYETYDYSSFKDADKKYKEVKDSLERYESEKNGKCVVIHGDAVMTNIIINNYDKIKFIDMRGKLGINCTLYGDYLYDWAKLYQSLSGYDEILQGKVVGENYKKEMMKYFEDYFVELYSESELMWVKLITRSLFFTLIPLHNNSKCKEYFNLS